MKTERWLDNRIIGIIYCMIIGIITYLDNPSNKQGEFFIFSTLSFATIGFFLKEIKDIATGGLVGFKSGIIASLISFVISTVVSGSLNMTNLLFEMLVGVSMLPFVCMGINFLRPKLNENKFVFYLPGLLLLSIYISVRLSVPTVFVAIIVGIVTGIIIGVGLLVLQRLNNSSQINNHPTFYHELKSMSYEQLVIRCYDDPELLPVYRSLKHQISKTELIQHILDHKYNIS